MTPAPQAQAAPIEDDPHRTLALELVRATEAAAIASARHFGRGDKNLVDGAAVDAMRPVLATVRMDGVVVIGEGEKDEAPMLYNGEQVGDGGGPEVDIAVDPIDGTTLAAGALPDAVSVVALSERGTMSSRAGPRPSHRRRTPSRRPGSSRWPRWERPCWATTGASTTAMAPVGPDTCAPRL